MKIIFLDIDGVLQPGSARDRFNHDLELFKQEKIAENTAFAEVDRYDLGAVFYDWAKDGKSFPMIGAAWDPP